MKYSVRHQTRYTYSDLVSMSYNRLHSKPRKCPRQSFGEARLTIDPEPAFLHPQTDFFGNPVTFFTVQKPHRELDVVVFFEAEVEARTVEDVSDSWESVAETLSLPNTPETLDASQFRFDSNWISRSAALTDFARASFGSRRPLLEGARELCSRIFEEFTFDNSATTLATPLEEVLRHRRGVCQDFAHLAIASMRGLGLAARYVSGYLLTMPPAGQERLQGADASHAWISVWAPPHGWVDLDPTNDCVVSDQHVTLAWGRDFHDVSPLRGVMLGGGSQSVRVGVDVLPLR